MKTEETLRYKLQFFAEGDDPNNTPDPDSGDKDVNKDNSKPDGGRDNKPDDDGTPQKTVEEKNIELMAKIKMLEKKLDKTNEKLSDTTKKYNDVLTDQQKTQLEEAERKAEEAEELSRLRKENAITKFEKSFLALGYSEDMATEAAEAQYENDTDTLMRIQSEFITLHDKQKEAEWQKNRPMPKSGGDEGEETNITLEQLNRMPYLKQVEFKNKHPETYKQLTNIDGGN